MRSNPSAAPRWAGYVAALFALEYAVAKVVMAGRGELGVPGHSAPPEDYERFSGDVVLAQLGNAALGLVTAALALALVTSCGRRVPSALLAGGAIVVLAAAVAGSVVVVSSLTGLREDHGQWGFDSLVLGVVPLVAWLVLAVASVRGERGRVKALTARMRGAARAATRPGRRAALAAATGCVAYGALKLDWALGGELLLRQTPLPAGAVRDMLERETWPVVSHWASVALAATGVALALATVRERRAPRLLAAGLPALIGVAMLLRAGWSAVSDVRVLAGAAGEPGYPAGWDLGLWSPFFAAWGSAWIAAARA